MQTIDKKIDCIGSHEMCRYWKMGFKKNLGSHALEVRSIKIFKSLLDCPTITAIVAAFDAKAFNDTYLLKSYLAVWNTVMNVCRQTNRKHHG